MLKLIKRIKSIPVFQTQRTDLKEGSVSQSTKIC